MELLKILALCFTAAMLAVLFKQYKSEYALVITAAAGISVIIAVIKGMIAPIAEIKTRLDVCGVDASCFTVALKALGIGYITGFIADACRDSGQSTLASKAELAGKCAIFIVSLPLMCTVLETAIGFM